MFSHLSESSQHAGWSSVVMTAIDRPDQVKVRDLIAYCVSSATFQAYQGYTPRKNLLVDTDLDEFYAEKIIGHSVTGTNPKMWKF